jgi:hypothetical protein
MPTTIGCSLALSPKYIALSTNTSLLDSGRAISSASFNTLLSPQRIKPDHFCGSTSKSRLRQDSAKAWRKCCRYSNTKQHGRAQSFDQPVRCVSHHADPTPDGGAGREADSPGLLASKFQLDTNIFGSRARNNHLEAEITQLETKAGYRWQIQNYVQIHLKPQNSLQKHVRLKKTTKNVGMVKSSTKKRSRKRRGSHESMFETDSADAPTENGLFPPHLLCEAPPWHLHFLPLVTFWLKSQS